MEVSVTDTFIDFLETTTTETVHVRTTSTVAYVPFDLLLRKWWRTVCPFEIRPWRRSVHYSI